MLPAAASPVRQQGSTLQNPKMAIPQWFVRRLRILPAALLALLLGRRLFGRRRVAAAAGAGSAIESALYVLRDER